MSTATRLDLGDGVHALSWGSRGAPIVLVHGLDGSAANWVAVGRLLADGHRVLAIDLPGFGRSPLGRHSSRMTAHADLVVRVGRAWAGSDGVALAGNSMGGVVALLAAARHPGFAERVTLVASALPRPGTGAVDPTILPAALSLWLPGAATAVAGRRNAQPPVERVRALLDLCVAPGTATAALPPDAVAEMVDAAAVRDRTDHVRAWGRSARSLWGWLARRGAFHAAADGLDEAGTTGVLLTGAEDPIVPTASADAFTARHPTWLRTDLPGIGHVPPLEAPTATAAAIIG